MPESPESETIEDQPRDSTGPGGGRAEATDVPFAAMGAQPPWSGLRSIFFGPDGLRAGWGVLIFVSLFLILLIGGSFLLQKVSDRIHNRPRTGAAHSLSASAAATARDVSPKLVFANEGLMLLSVALATWVMARIERRKLSAYGFKPQRRLRYFCTGLASGVALLSLLIVLLRATGLLVFDRRLLFGGSMVRYGLIWLAEFLVVGLTEESISRAYLQFTLTRGLSAIGRMLFGPGRANALGFWTAALILSFGFGFGHRTNPGESPLGLVSAGMAGLLFCFSLWRTGSLWWAIGFHATWDWAQSFLYGVADSGVMVKGHLFATHPLGRPILSGGLTGPEGSILLLPIVAVAAILVLLSLPRTHAGYLPASPPQASPDSTVGEP